MPRNTTGKVNRLPLTGLQNVNRLLQALVVVNRFKNTAIILETNINGLELHVGVTLFEWNMK